MDLELRSPSLEPPGYEYVELVEALEQPDISILVQAHDWSRLPEIFQREIEWLPRDGLSVLGEQLCGRVELLEVRTATSL